MWYVLILIFLSSCKPGEIPVEEAVAADTKVSAKEDNKDKAEDERAIVDKNTYLTICTSEKSSDPEVLFIDYRITDSPDGRRDVSCRLTDKTNHTLWHVENYPSKNSTDKADGYCVVDFWGQKIKFSIIKTGWSVDKDEYAAGNCKRNPV